MEEKYDVLVVVDVQPFYENGFEYMTDKYIEKLEKTTKPIVYYFVGEELANETKGDVIMFLLKNGLSEEKCDRIKFIEKDYGFYRSFMDYGISSDGVVSILKEMKEEGISDLRDIFDEGYDSISEWKPSLVNILNTDDLIKADTLLKGGDTLFIPYLNEKLLNSFPKDSKFELIGGGRWECLEEIAIHLKSNDKNIEVNEHLCFGAEPIDYSNKKKNKHRL